MATTTTSGTTPPSTTEARPPSARGGSSRSSTRRSGSTRSSPGRSHGTFATCARSALRRRRARRSRPSSPAVGAEPGQLDLAAAEGEADGRVHLLAQVSERVVVHVRHRAAPLADEVVVPMLVRRLVERAPGAEVGPADEPLLDEQLQRPVARLGIYAPHPLAQPTR